MATVNAALLALVLLAPQLEKRREAQRQRHPELPVGVQVHRDLKYGPASGRANLLDLYLPPAPIENRPLVIWVHGGAWLAGDKAGGPALRLVGRGYAVASINYRLSPEARFPAQIEDCQAAVRWLRAHAERYGLDSDRFGAWGSSAGGHLVALLGTASDSRAWTHRGPHEQFSCRVQAVCDWFGPTDFTQMAAHSLPTSRLDHDSPSSPEARLIGGPVQLNKELCARANPITYISKDDPPFLIMHGDRDDVVPHHQSELLHEVLRRAGVPSALHTVKGAGHGLGGPDVFRLVDEFFDRHLRPKTRVANESKAKAHGE